MNARLVLALVAMLAALCYMYSIDFAKGQEAHTHEGAIGRFYQSWMMPDNPDGRNHLCAPPPHYGDRVYCFSVGGGT